MVTWNAEAGATVVKRSSEEALDPGLVSQPRRLEFASAGGRRSHAFYYPPANPDVEGPADELPPLIVQSHGGPTGHSPPMLQQDILFWTSRGFGVVDVNYGGSSGFGREYRDALQGQWGIVDTEDCLAAAQHLVEQGEVDGERLAIHGGSAGGYTTLCALAFHDLFAAGASYYGVADAELLAEDTHKFESRYLDGLIGPYPETAARWRERSPIHFADRIRAAVILFQGLEDEVVPPSQAEQMVEALAANHVPHAYLAVRGRAARLPARGDDRGEPRGRAVVLRADLRLRAGGRDRAGPDRALSGGRPLDRPRLDVVASLPPWPLVVVAAVGPPLSSSPRSSPPWRSPPLSSSPARSSSSSRPESSTSRATQAPSTRLTLASTRFRPGRSAEKPARSSKRVRARDRDRLDAAVMVLEPEGLGRGVDRHDLAFELAQRAVASASAGDRRQRQARDQCRHDGDGCSSDLHHELHLPVGFAELVL